MHIRRDVANRKGTKRPTRGRGETGRAGPMGPPGPEGQRGARGARGAQGAPGFNHVSEIAVLRAQVEQLVKELQTQLTRIGQIQAQLDHVSSGQASEPRNRRSTDRTDH